MQCEIKEERGRARGLGREECEAATVLDQNVRLLADSLADWVSAEGLVICTWWDTTIIIVNVYNLFPRVGFLSKFVSKFGSYIYSQGVQI